MPDDLHHACIKDGEDCVPLIMENPDTGERRLIAWMHYTWRIVLHNMLTGDKEELDPFIAIAEGQVLKLPYKAEDWERYPIWEADA